MQHAHRITRLSALALGITGALAFGQVQASGFQLKENSVKAMGSAFAGSGVKTGDTSVVVNNPATMTQFEGTTVQVDATVIDLNYEYRGSGEVLPGTLFEAPLTGGDGGNAGDVTPVPAMSVVHKFDNGLALGAMVSAPFGLKTEYEDGWVGRYSALTSDVQIVDLTVSAAVDVIPDRLSVGIGATYSKADVTLSKAVDFGTLLFLQLPNAAKPTPPAFATPQARDGVADVEGDDTGFGWTVGVNARPTDKLSVGLSYRSEVDYELTGTVDWTVPQDVRAVFDNPLSPATNPLFRNGAVSAKLTTPSITSFEVAYRFTDRFSMAASWTETGWSSLREVRVDFANPDPDSVEPFAWRDTTFISLGAEFKLNEAWTLRAGTAFDETPTHIETRTPRLPDDDRNWYSIGATWQATDALEVNFGYTRVEPDNPRIDLTTETRLGNQTVDTTHLVGPFDGNANLLGVSAQYKF